MGRPALAALAALVAVAACRGDARTRATAPPPSPLDAAPPRDSRPWFPDDASIAAHVAELAGPALRGRGSGTALAMAS